MDWRAKALLQAAFSRVPLGEGLNHLFQRHVTRSLPLDDVRFLEVVESARRHVELLARHGARPLGEATFFEFGAGWDLVVPLALWAFGVERQILVDIRPLGRSDLVRQTLRKLARLELPAGVWRRPSREPPEGPGFLAALRASYGIEYLAPCDARQTGLGAETLDCVTSTNTLEHIPPDEILAILRECRRLLRPGGRMSFHIDYQDHYSYFDRGISVYNFLRYSDRRWRLWSPALHFQNRLRHRDHLALFEHAGLALLAEETAGGSPEDLAALARVPLDGRFSGYTAAELAVRSAWVVLAPGATAP